MNIIITNIGRRGYLADYFKEIPEMTGMVFTSDCDRTASGLYGKNDGHFILPKPVENEELYVEKLIEVCKENDIGAIIPVIDPEVYILSGFRERFIKNGITIVVSDRNVLDICFNKLLMNDFLEKTGVSYPKTYKSVSEFKSALDRKEISFPVIMKPILGSGSVETYFIDNMAKIEALFYDGMIIQEKLVGIEYGADTFNSFEGETLRCVIKRKISMRSGETDKSISVHNSEIQDLLLKIARELKHIGNLDCDIIISKGIPYVIDMNPRFGGGYPATHTIGVNLIGLLYRLLNGEFVSPEFGNYKDNILVMKGITVRSTTFTEL